MPIPSFGFVQSYTETSLDIPVSAKVRATAARLRLFTWVCLLGGITAAMLSLLKTVPWLRGSEAGLLFGGITLACVSSIARWWMLRKVCIIRSLNNFIRVRFHNEEYARQFSQMNRLLCESR